MSVKVGSIKTIPGKRGNTYCVQIRMKGHPHLSKTFKELRLAKKWLQETVHAIQNGLPYETKVMRTHSFAQLVDKYILECVDPSSTNYVTRVGQLRWWKQQMGHLSLTHIREDVISACRNKLINSFDRFGSPRSPATVNRYMTSLSALLRVAANEWKLVPYNPLKNFQKLKEPLGKDHFLSEAEIERLLKACKASSNKNLYTIVLLALCTGMRKREITHLTWQDINFDEEMIKLEKTKNGDRRYIPLKEPIFSILQEKAKNEDSPSTAYIFKSSRNSGPLNFRSAWEKVLKEADISNFVFHSLRGTCVTHLSRLGFSLHTIARIVGHREISVTYKRYACLGLDEHAVALEKLGGFLEKLK